MAPKPLSLRRLCGLAALSAADEDLIRNLKPTTFSPGSVLSRNEDCADGAYILLAGWGARKLGKARSQRAAFFLLPGDSIGLNTPRWAADEMPVVALTPVIAANAEEVRRVLLKRPQDHPRLVSACRRAVWRDQELCLSAILRLGHQSAEERVAHLLLELHMRLSEVALAANGRFDLPLTQDVIAQALGLSHVHLSRTLRTMKRDGWIEFSTGRIQLLEMEKLTAICGFSPTPLAEVAAIDQRPAH